MAYSELIKSFEKIRGYMREFYVYGFKSREEYDSKSSRSYDNERRRIESWLGDHMSFRQDKGGKAVFLTVDNRTVAHNPLYKAFKAKSFTDNDISLHFYIMDILAEGEALSVREIVERISTDYLADFEQPMEADESTVRKKLREYEAMGLLESTKLGRKLCYRRAADETELDTWREALGFYSEIDPLGVVGSYLLDRLPGENDSFSFKHHYLLHALDSELLYQLLLAIKEHRAIELCSFAVRKNELRNHTVLPLKIYISCQSGRQYLLGYHYRQHRPMFFRMDNIRKVQPGAVETRLDKYADFHDKFRENLWGVSTGVGHSLDHIEMSIRVGQNEGFILERLEREKRCGRIEAVDSHTYKFVADVYDASEMLPWIRTYTGRIVKLECSNSFVLRRFQEDLEAMHKLYGGDTDAVQ